MKTKNKIIGLLVVVGGLIGALVAYRSWTGPSVEVVQIKTSPLVQSVVSNGRVLAPAKVQIGSVLLGVVDHVDVEEGQVVKKGTLMIQLHHQELLAAVEQAKAGVRLAQIQLQQVRSVRAPAAQQQLKQSEVSLSQAQNNYERAHDLLQRGAITQVQFDESRVALELAESRYKGSTLDVQSASRAGVEYLLARTSVDQAQAALDAANARLAQTSITAPADGVVLSRQVEPGDVVQPGKVLLVFARSGETKILVSFDEKNLSYLHIGQAAQVATDAFSDQSFAATVDYIAPSIDERRGSIDVKLLVTKPPAFLLTDMTASVEVEVGRRDDAMSLPKIAIFDAASRKPWVFVVRDNVLVKQVLSLGLLGTDKVEISSGLSVDDLVVEKATQSLREGQRVRAQLKVKDSDKGQNKNLANKNNQAQNIDHGKQIEKRQNMEKEN